MNPIVGPYSVTKTGSNLEELKAEHAAAINAVDAENRKRLDQKRKVNDKSAPPAEKPASGPEFKDGKPVFGSRPSPKAGTAPSLFDSVEKQPDAAEDVTPASPSA